MQFLENKIYLNSKEINLLTKEDNNQLRGVGVEYPIQTLLNGGIDRVVKNNSTYPFFMNNMSAFDFRRSNVLYKDFYKGIYTQAVLKTFNNYTNFLRKEQNPFIVSDVYTYLAKKIKLNYTANSTYLLLLYGYLGV